jgi:hypothetical protein
VTFYVWLLIVGSHEILTTQGVYAGQEACYRDLKQQATARAPTAAEKHMWYMCVQEEVRK